MLKQSGQIPGQYVLEYFTDQSQKKVKGRIDLDQCEQVGSLLDLQHYFMSLLIVPICF